MSKQSLTAVPRLDELSLEHKVGQVVMGGFPDPVADPATLQAVRDGILGNIVLFARNCPDPTSVRELTRSLQAVAPIPLLIATDQEGGTVTRLTQGATVMPGAMALGATNDLTLAERAAQVVGQEMRAVGINLILAPVADVNSNPHNPIIGLRAFGEDPSRVADFVQATLRGFRAAGIAGCVKHFPGHGDTAADSHTALPLIPHSLAHLEQVELVPFRAAIDAGTPMVMTTHILFPALDPANPGTLSRAILTDLLRGRLGFAGVVLTDSMEMEGVLGGRTTPQACLDAFAAGADIVCVSHDRADQAATHALILDAVRAGRVPAERLDQAVGRVLRLKAWLAAQPAPSADDQARVGSPAHLAVAQEIAARAVTVVRDDRGWLPLAPGRLGVVEFGQPRFSLAEEEQVGGSALAGALTAHRPLRALSLNVTPTPDDSAQAQALADDSDVVVVGTRSANLYPGQVELVQQLLHTGKPVVVVALRAPYDLTAFPEAPAFVASFGDTWAPLLAVASVLVGTLAARGKLPVSLPGLYPRGHSL